MGMNRQMASAMAAALLAMAHCPIPYLPEKKYHEDSYRTIRHHKSHKQAMRNKKKGRR